MSIEAARVAIAISRIHALPGPVTISGDAGDDARKYQEKAVKAAIAEATR